MDPQKAQRSSAAKYVFIEPRPGRLLMRAALVISVVVLLAGCFFVATERSAASMVVTGVAVGFVVVLWALLQSRIPQRITVDGSMIEIRRAGQTERFDLEDPGVDIRVGDGEIAFAHYLDRWVVVRSRDVDWKVFSDIVMRYQANADRYAEERDKRFGA